MTTDTIKVVAMRRMYTELLVLAIFVLASCRVTAQSELAIPNDVFEFGFVPQKSTVVHYFWFKSVGADTLVITEIKTGCSCALMPLERDRIAPGDSMKVGIFWDMQRRMGKTARHPYIFTNAKPDPYRVHLSCTALRTSDSLRPVAFKPYKFELARYGQKSIDSISFTVRNVADRQISITPLSFPVDECEIYMPEAVPSNSESIGYIKVREEYLDKEFRQSITVLLDDDKKTRITIPIRRKFY